MFGLPLEIGVIITALDVFLILGLQNLGFRWIEAFVVALLMVIAVCFAAQIALANPEWGPLMRGFIPTTDIVKNPDMLFLALGIIGATVMPHNLYLHSAIVQTRAYGETEDEKRSAIKYATIDLTVALMFALLINASILIPAAATFHKTGRNDIAELGDAHALLMPLLGASIAPTLFGIALLACGLNSTVTATLAGQAVMEGFIDFHLAVGPASGHTVGCDRAGCDRHADLWLRRDGAVADPEPGRTQFPTAVRDRTAGDDGRQAEDGGAGGTAMG